MDWLPAVHFHERHGRRGVPCTPEALIAAVRGFDDRSDPLLNGLLWLREWPARHLLPAGARRRIPAERPRFGLAQFVVLESTPARIVYGLAGRFWQADFGLVPLADGQAFRRFGEPGAAKLVLAFGARAAASGRGSDLETVTAVHCCDAAARRRFLPYWLLVRPFSGWIRRRLLSRIQAACAPDRQGA
ncbi:hypothetical protein [Aquincola agrisoli]